MPALNLLKIGCHRYNVKKYTFPALEQQLQLKEHVENCKHKRVTNSKLKYLVDIRHSFLFNEAQAKYDKFFHRLSRCTDMTTTSIERRVSTLQLVEMTIKALRSCR